MAGLAPARTVRSASISFPPHINQGRLGCFIPPFARKGSSARPGVAVADEALATEFQAILDQSSAPWWDPATLWDRAKDRTADVFADHHPGAAHALLGQAA
jgi:hypothetical protein